MADGSEVTEEKEGDVEEGRREVRGGEEEEETGSEAVPSWLWLLLKVQALPFILLRLPMELRMTVARLRDSLDRSRLGGTLRSRLVLIRFCKSEEKVPAYKTENTHVNVICFKGPQPPGPRPFCTRL